MKKILDTPYVYYELQEDLLIGTYKKGLKITVNMVKEIIKTRLEFQEYKPVVALIYNQGVLKMEKKAREYFASRESTEGIIAAAFVVDSPFTSFMANFFVSVNKPRMPVRIFTNEKDALKWLQKFRKINSGNG